MLSDIDPMAVTLVIVAVAVVGTIIGVARRGRTEPVPDPMILPVGADAALWSITEVIPDPRNHLAIKDPTSELRLTARERAEAEATATAPQVRPADAARSAQSIAARRAALAKRHPAEHEPLTIFPDAVGDADARHLTLLPEDLCEPAPGTADGSQPAARWGEAPARAS